ncbi:beta-fructofuranosidase [Lachnospiraceae bacterium C10]|nr:beta-fructofuranosidase [Lachnospiraceae bacterium C10]
MRKWLCGLLAVAMGVSMAGCGTVTQGETEQEAQEAYLGEKMDNHDLFPLSVEGYVGDTMPFYEDGTYHIFYLADQRSGKQGYHPWALMDTSDYCTYDDKGVVINFGDSGEDQDIALGTGSVVRDAKGVYHAFYTGHNDVFEPKEAVMHATSTDLKKWTKIPEDTFTADKHYSKNDFRDPYVRYMEEEKCYWMLVTTRYEDNGVIVKYTSKDLTHWKDGGVFFENDMGTDSNMECPTLLPYQGKWYLSFSDQWPNRQVHYRVADAPTQNFVKPERDTFDCNGFYAGRLETDGEELYVVGWNGTKRNHDDSEEYDWGGNLVAHLLKKQEDGSLSPVMNPKVKELLSGEIALSPLKMTDHVSRKKDSYAFSGNAYEAVGFPRLMGSYRLETTIRDYDDKGMFGFAFHTNDDNVGNVNIALNPAANRIEFYNTGNIRDSVAQSTLDYDFSNKEELHISLVISGGVVVMYVNDEVAFTTRMYLSQGMPWGMFGMNSKVTFDKVKLYK